MITSNIHLISADFAAMSAMMVARSKTAITKATIDVQSDMMIASPVGNTGNFRSNWAHTPADTSGTEAIGSVYNSIIYADVLEKGSMKGESPWRKAGPRTIEHEGRVWSSQAVGGVMGPIIDDEYTDKITKQITDFVFGGFGLVRWHP